ncbi:uncharacterized protein LOC130944204 isoform X2 [Arachis stenosperma]|uniref:uncharacterized protein LOC130944204 isoform X2 n=1 Tax=Arachis stenosperma TaxID=217475 RepID=UPI0025ABA8AE|nr:uncharacterized protein LOC130944204 isoform X2 [Arachis stenosperma]
MRLSSKSGSSSKHKNVAKSSPWLRKKHKRLDAICEKEYNRNHGDSNGCDDALITDAADSAVRRSSRVRRAPVLLDASPAPPKKRRKLGKVGVPAGRIESGKKNLEQQSPGSSIEGSPSAWRSRLRSRARGAGFEVNDEKELPRRKRKLFEDVVVSRGDDELKVDKKKELEGGVPRIVKSKRPARIKATKHEEELKVNESHEVEPKENESHEEGLRENESHKETLRENESHEEGLQENESSVAKQTEKESYEGHRENECHGNLDESNSQEVELTVNKEEGNDTVPVTDVSGGNLVIILDVNGPPIIGNGERNMSSNLQTEECSGGSEQSPLEHADKQDDQWEHANKQDDQLACEKEGNNASEGAEIAGISTKQVENEGSADKEVEIDENTLKDANYVTKDKLKQASNGSQRIKEGRRCGLCGGGTDGKPPKRLLQDNGESENEAYSGSSASEEPNFDIWDGFSDEPGWLGHLLGPINDNFGIARIWVHQQCAVWSPEVYFAGLGCLKNVRAALYRGRALKCTRCGRRGATSGCRVDRCPKTYHLPCARASGCIFDHRKFLIACTDHRHLFQPHGNKYLARIKKLKARKLKWDMRKHSNDAWRKDIAAEERWLENCGEDEEFLKRENKRLHRDLLRIAPVYIGGSDSACEPSFQGWESVAGLKDVIRCMKEVVILPLLYPELFDNLGLTPPRGVLLHGYPGTGKTLVVRALIGACARGDRRIAYFARKGADCLGKYVGDAERQLRLLFQVAERCQPSIIFFDEIDGLAPTRTRQQDQTHSSVVSTLLALMDGLKSRGSVVVIGATNRPDAVDPALRRPGRFDREIYFPLPSTEDRASILSLHTQRWPKPITGSLLEWIAKKTPGYAGADLQALCTQAAINALKRNFPLQEVLSLAEEKHSGWKNLSLPSFAVEERDWLEAFLHSPLPCSRREAGNATNDVVCSPLPIHLIPCLLGPLCTLLVSLDENLWLPPPLSKAVTVIKNEVVSALDKRKMPIDHWWLHIDDLLQETNIASEIKSKLMCLGILSANDGFGGSPDTADDTDDSTMKSDPSIKNHLGMRSGLFLDKSFAFTNKSGFRILISGNPRSGQRHLASCFLYCFVGSTEIQKIDMATASQEGHGDVVQGIAQILLKCASLQSCILFMPRIDLWAVNKHVQIYEKESEFNTEKSSAEITEGEANKKASHAWMSFIEQVESIGVSTSLMILATSEVSYTELPSKIREFFKSYQSKDSQSTPLQQTIPRLSLHLDSNFDNETLITLSVEELLRNLVEQQIQLIHQSSHVHLGVRKVSVEACEEKVCQSKDNGSVDEEKSETQVPKSTSAPPPPPPPPDGRSLKEKSTLSLAISTFGYQILLFPHFAELCWVTSKLKEGPCADVSGPWRGGWPFNSCVIRPNNSLDNSMVPGSSGGDKSKERSGLVRGLIAVGLLAYRGVYKSAREVSLDVRKVLEILIENINAKIQAGKDRYQYLRILSQVAYLEDIVNNWAYALHSMDKDSLEPISKVMSSSDGLNSHLSCVDHQAETKDVHMNGDDLENPGRSCKEIHAETTGFPAMNKKNDNTDKLDHDGRHTNTSAKECLPNDSLNNHSDDSAAANQPVDPSPNQQNGLLSREVAEGDVRMSEELGKYTSTHSAVLSENGLHTALEQGLNGGTVSTISNQPPTLSTEETGVTDVYSRKHENATGIDISSSKGHEHAEPAVVCMYQCCPRCLHSLYLAIRKLLTSELSVNHRTVEDVHDAVSSLSVDLISAIRKCHIGDLNDFSNKTFKRERHGITLNLRTCDPKNQDKDFVAAECVTHSTSQEATATKDEVVNESLKLDLKFIFRDGVLVPMNPDKDVSLHCKVETLCLCSLRELIVMTKSPFD